MLSFTTQAFIPHAKKEQVTDFFINCTTAIYWKWWKWTHLEFYTIKKTEDILWDMVYIDEYVGKTRLKFKAKISQYIRGKILEYQMIKVCALPVWLTMRFKDTPDGVIVFHTLKAGYTGIWKVLDYFIGLYLWHSFEQELTEHAKEEFIKLGNLLKSNT